MGLEVIAKAVAAKLITAEPDGHARADERAAARAAQAEKLVPLGEAIERFAAEMQKRLQQLLSGQSGASTTQSQVEPPAVRPTAWERGPDEKVYSANRFR